MRVTVQLDGVQESLNKLRDIDESISRRIIRAGVRAACKVGARHGKGEVPIRYGHLRKSLGWKIAKARKGRTAVGVVGPRSGFKKDGHDPTKYAHLVDQGTKPHLIRGRMVFTAGGRPITTTLVHHPGTKPTNFMRRIYHGGLGAMSAAFVAKVDAELHREAAKLKPSTVDDG